MKKFGYSKINALICNNLHLITIRLNAEGVITYISAYSVEIFYIVL